MALAELGSREIGVIIAKEHRGASDIVTRKPLGKIVTDILVLHNENKIGDERAIELLTLCEAVRIAETDPEISHKLTKQEKLDVHYSLAVQMGLTPVRR